jgi:undecaprenyl-phosphate galactose phosphotransferase
MEVVSTCKESRDLKGGKDSFTMHKSYRPAYATRTQSESMIKRNVGMAVLMMSDILSVLIILVSAIFIREHVLTRFYEFPEFPDIGVGYFWWIFPIWIFFFAYEGLYSRRFSFWDEVKVLWKASFFAILAMFSILYLGKIGERFSRTVLVLAGTISLPLMPIIRMNIKRFLIRLGLLRSKVLILGAGKTGEMILNALRRDRNMGMEVVGFLDDDPAKIGKRLGGIKIHAGVDSAHKYIGRCGIEDVVIAMPGCDREKFTSLVNKLQHRAQNLLLIPDLFGVTVLGTNLQHFFQEQAIGLEVKNNLARPLNRALKKVFDFTVSSMLLLILAIPMLIISAIIVTTSKGPAIFSQLRVGRNGRPFRCYKFRTMYSDAEARLSSILDNDADARAEWKSNFKLRNDPRITPIGRFLRRTSLDELPQIFNVLRGEMSLVGPRPVTQFEIDEYYRDQAGICFCVPPGITGLWQVSGRSNTGYAYRIALDVWYVRNWNLWLDIVILMKTVRVVIRHEGAV